MKHQKNGFTIVELLLYMGVFSMLLMVLLQIFTSILSTHLESQATSGVDQNINFISTRLAHDIHNATTIESPVLGVTSSTLHITGNALDQSYTLSGGKLLLTNNLTGSSDELNSFDSQVAASFTTLGNSAVGSKKSVQATLTVSSSVKREGGVTQSKTIMTSVQTR